MNSTYEYVELETVCSRITVGWVGPMADRYVSHGIPFLRSLNIAPFRLLLDGIKFIPEVFHDDLSKSALKPGDVAVVRTGTPGTACVIPPSLPISNCSDLVVITPSDRLNPHYLAAIFNSAFGQSAVSGQLVGVAQQHFNIGSAKKMRLALPPRSIQDRIAGILSAYDDLIENNRKRIAILDEMARRLYREWFVHFRYPGHESVPLVDSPLGRIPQGWDVQRVDAVCRSVLDGDWIETKDQGGSDYRLLQISNIGLGDFVETENYRYVTQSTFDRLRCTEIQPDDLLIARMPTPIGRAWLARKMPWRMITAVDVAIVRPNPNHVDPVYLLYFWNQPATLALIEKQSTGTTRLRITRRELCALLVPTPIREVQGLFAQQVRPMLDLANNLWDQSDILRRTRDLLLPRLMSGRLSVSAAEAAVP